VSLHWHSDTIFVHIHTRRDMRMTNPGVMTWVGPPPLECQEAKGLRHLFERTTISDDYITWTYCYCSLCYLMFGEGMENLVTTGKIQGKR
jgi:hypothetical protein